MRFLSEKLKISISVPDSIFRDQAIENQAENFVLNLIYPTSKPSGFSQLKFSHGIKTVPTGHKGKAIVWENLMAADSNPPSGDPTPVPQTEAEIDEWLVSAHEICESIFFNLIEGELHEQYQ